MKQLQAALAMAGAGVSLLMLAMPVRAADTVDAAKASALAASNACMGCHAIKSNIVGPSFDSITTRYKNDPDAVPKLTSKVLKGGAGVWGMIPMPSHPGMSQADAETVVKWIMAGSPSK